MNFRLKVFFYQFLCITPSPEKAIPLESQLTIDLCGLVAFFDSAKAQASHGSLILIVVGYFYSRFSIFTRFWYAARVRN